MEVVKVRTKTEDALVGHLMPPANHVSPMAFGELVVADVKTLHAFTPECVQDVRHLFCPGDSFGFQLKREEYVREVWRRVAINELGGGTRVDDTMQRYETVPANQYI